MDHLKHVKQAPVQGVTGLWGGTQGALTSGGGEDPIYVEEVFSTNLWTGDNGTNRTINNGIDLSSEGGLVWLKRRNSGGWHHLYDTQRGALKAVYSNEEQAPDTYTNTVKSFGSDGFTVGNNTNSNVSPNPYSSFTFRKTEKFFDVVQFSGSGAEGKVVNHSLGCRPGMIMLKRIDAASKWHVWHHDLTQYNDLRLNETAAMSNNYIFGAHSDMTSTTFKIAVGGNSLNFVNQSGSTWIAYVFAGGPSNSYLASSVDFDDDDGLNLGASSDLNLGTGQFCIECWVYLNDAPATGSPSYARVFQLDGPTGNSDHTNLQITINPSNSTLHAWAYGSSNPVAIVGSKNLKGGWHHIAVVRDSNNLITQYVDGMPDGTVTTTQNFNPNSGSPRVRIGQYDTGGTNGVFNGKISNLRVTVGEPVYTSAFKPSTTPLTTSSEVTSSSNVKFLCCNNGSNDSSVVGSTVKPSGVSFSGQGNPTLRTSSGAVSGAFTPFSDADGFVFGEDNDENILTCGSYTGNSNSNGPNINLGWEAQWLLVKRLSNTEDWMLFDHMRTSERQDMHLDEYRPNVAAAEYDGAGGDSQPFLNWTSTGFKLSSNTAHTNDDEDIYIYIAVRRPDGYVAKLPTAGTEVFTPIAGSSGAPMFKTPNHYVDMSLQKNSNYTSSAADWNMVNRLISKEIVQPNTTAAETYNSLHRFDFQHGESSYTSGSGIRFSWNFKRHAGFDVVHYTGNGVHTSINHSLGKIPEMIWIKNRTDSVEWTVGHIGLDGGSSPWEHYIVLNSNTDENGSLASGDNIFWGSGPPSATHFNVGSWTTTNTNNKKYVALLWSSISGISKVGYYSGSNSNQTITTGFQPRFCFMKKIDTTQGWVVLDTVRGWASGNDERLEFHNDSYQSNSIDFGAPTSTGFTLLGNVEKTNQSGGSYIYYAHA